MIDNTPRPLPFHMAIMGWEGDGSTGYAHIASQLRRSLAVNGFQAVDAYSDDWDALLAITTPVRWVIGNDHRQRPDVIFHTMFEGTSLPKGWVETMNCAGLIWTPSQFCYDLFRESGVTTPMFVAGYGVEDEYEEVVREHREDAPMRFIVWADTIIGRKNVQLAVKAFIDAGITDAELEIKLHSFAGMNRKTAFTDVKGNPLANITIHTGAWPRSRVINWLGTADCGIYASGGEGFGLMPLQQMKTGLPMIVAANTGMMEYIKPGNCIPIPCPTIKRDIAYSVSYHYDCYMHSPDYEALVEAIRWAAKNRDKLRVIGEAGAAEARKWTWDEQTKIAALAIRKHYGKL